MAIVPLSLIIDTLYLNSWKQKGIVTKPLKIHRVFMMLKKLHTEKRMLLGRVYA